MNTWRDIPDPAGRYQVSSAGLVRNSRSLRVLTPQRNNSGYQVVHLAEGKTRQRTVALVHRLVAAAFISPPPPGKEVNHRNGDKQDNRVENLEWVTRQQNVRHAHAMGLAVKTPGHPVVGTSVQDGTQVRFANQKAAEVALSGKQSSAVHHCLVGKKRSAYGYVWARA